jgi:hypothetical protein
MKKFIPFALAATQCLAAWQLLTLSMDTEMPYGLRMGFGAIGLLTLIQANWTYTNALRGEQ